MASNKVASPLMLGAALLGVMPPYAGYAAPPAALVSGQFAKSDVLLVAGGCGRGFHPGPYGYCLPNGPVVVPPPAAVESPVVVAPRMCPPGYRLGPYGRRCLPVGVYGPPPGYGPPAGYAPPPRGNPAYPRRTRILLHRRPQGSCHLRPKMKWVHLRTSNCGVDEPSKSYSSPCWSRA
jgi:hypothetical protein